MKINTIATILIIELLLLPLVASAQDDGFIYGKVTTIEGNSYEGPMRWGKEEVYWTDMFNAGKTENNAIQYLNREEREYLDDLYHDQHGSWDVRWIGDWDYDSDHSHQFACQFGELKSLQPKSRNEVDIELQNGQKFEIDGDGYNDIGTKVKILDQEIGEIEINWGRIDKIEFIKTPSSLRMKFGDALYGTVETDQGDFTGFVQWDHDERVSDDQLDGDTEDGDVSIAFGKIASIERMGSSRSNVILKSGREFELRGSNDVNSENRGIIVTIAGVGRVDIEWDEFRKVEFSKAPNSGKSYSDFSSQNQIYAKVTTSKNETFDGRMIFDLDEEYDYEVLHGEDDDLEYIIPFRNISSIIPKNYDYSQVILKSGDKLILGESQDVSDKNTGIIVFNKNDEPKYIPWEYIEEIKIK